MISGFLFWTLYPKVKTWKSWKFYKSWKFSIIRNWNTFHMTSNSKWFRHIVHHVVAGLCLLIASNSSRFIKLSPFFFLCQFQHSKSHNSGRKMKPHVFERYQPENKDYPWFPGFCFKSFTPKNENLEITEILQECHNTEIWEYSFKNKLKLTGIVQIAHYPTYLFRENKNVPLFYFLPLSLKLMKLYAPIFVTFSVSFYDFEHLKLWKTMLFWQIARTIFRTGYG